MVDAFVLMLCCEHGRLSSYGWMRLSYCFVVSWGDCLEIGCTADLIPLDCAWMHYGPLSYGLCMDALRTSFICIVNECTTDLIHMYCAWMHNAPKFANS